MFAQQNFQLGLLVKLRSSLELVRWADMNDGWGGGGTSIINVKYFIFRKRSRVLSKFIFTLTCAYFVNKLWDPV
jgi:hypothetical protein